MKRDVWNCVHQLHAVPNEDARAVYEAALVAVVKGRDVHHIVAKMIEIGVSGEQAARLSLWVFNRATAIMRDEQNLAGGAEYAVWQHIGVPCYFDQPATSDDYRRDSAHKSASGKHYRIADGLTVQGRDTHPGMEPGCKCTSHAIVPGNPRDTY